MQWLLRLLSKVGLIYAVVGLCLEHGQEAGEKALAPPCSTGPLKPQAAFQRAGSQLTSLPWAPPRRDLANCVLGYLFPFWIPVQVVAEVGPEGRRPSLLNPEPADSASVMNVARAISASQQPQPQPPCL